MLETWRYCYHDYERIFLFVALNYLICATAFSTWKTMWFWGILILMYMLWGGIFRYYFKRKPYLRPQELLSSLIPSTKIMVLTVLIVTAFILLPLVPLFVPILPPDKLDKYSHFLQLSMQESDLLDSGINLLLVLLSPIILYRPFLAWISALIGRSRSLRFVWRKTVGNYWEFLLLAILIDVSMGGFYQGTLILGGNGYIALIPISVLIIYFNLVMAKIYEFFFETEQNG